MRMERNTISAAVQKTTQDLVHLDRDPPPTLLVQAANAAAVAHPIHLTAPPIPPLPAQIVVGVDETTVAGEPFVAHMEYTTTKP